ncbi:uncharacterized protein LOC122933219 isoform X2 [Bufo gargarizans]|uniref:uncharacterized protein LOC122933219 isoform X2 n=1 Tax=Bufo gargarizans TaxID=30331 RepID=UPI001CF177E5|nr:uncharacterized protein LOC122933219 isoform X2 [Bufo gargarizans]
MMLVKSWLFQAVLVPMAFQLFFSTWIQCSSDIQVREVQAAVMGSVTITFKYDTFRYRNLISSWCRQVTITECENIMDTSVTSNNGYKGRLFLSQNTERTGIVNVTMVNLQHWDTGLYKWRIWTGTEYSIIENVLLQVVFGAGVAISSSAGAGPDVFGPSEGPGSSDTSTTIPTSGLPSRLHVAIFKAYDSVEMSCEYNQKQTWSKAWYKMMGLDNLQWLVHSDGNINMDYSSRSTVFVYEQKRVLEMKITNLELWDSGLYQCRESGGETILNEILLLVTLEEMYEDRSEYSTLAVSEGSSTSPNIVQDNIDNKYVSPVDVKYNVSNGQNGNSTGESNHKIEHHGAWDILRWMLFLFMGLCVLLSTYYEKISAYLTYI